MTGYEFVLPIAPCLRSAIWIRRTRGYTAIFMSVVRVSCVWTVFALTLVTIVSIVCNWECPGGPTMMSFNLHSVSLWHRSEAVLGALDVTSWLNSFIC